MARPKKIHNPEPKYPEPVYPTPEHESAPDPVPVPVITIGDYPVDVWPLRVQLDVGSYCLFDDGLLSFFVPGGSRGTVVGLNEDPELDHSVTVAWDAAFVVDRRKFDPTSPTSPVKGSVQGWIDTSVHPESLKSVSLASISPNQNV